MDLVHLLLLLFGAFCLASALVQAGRGVLDLVGCLGSCVRDVLRFSIELRGGSGHTRLVHTEQ